MQIDFGSSKILTNTISYSSDGLSVEQQGKYTISSSNDYMEVKLEGLISADVVIRASADLLKAEEYYSGKPVIWIATTADLSTVELEMVEAAVKDIDQIYEGLQLGKIALVTERTINIWTIEFFKEMYDKDMVRVFDTLEEAREWALSK